MLNIDIIYIIINLLLFLVFISAGLKISNGENYRGNAILCVVVFTLALGLRYARGNDYLHYQDIYVHGYDEGSQLAFSFINESFKFIGVSKYGIFIVYSFIEIVCSLIFLRRYRQYAQYMFPLFLIAVIVFDEYQIRQALGFSFVFLCLDSLTDIPEKWYRAIRKNLKPILRVIIYFTIAYSIHSACGYMLVIMIGFFLFYKRTIPLIISIPALLFSAYFFSEWFDFGWLNPILSQFAGEDERMSTYLEDSDVWFSAKGQDDKYVRNPYVLAAEMFGTISLYILGSKVINKYVKRADAFAMYNFFVIGTIILNAFRTLELLNRIGGDFAMFWFFPLTLVLYYRKKLYTNFFYKVISVFLLWYVYDYLKYLFMKGEMTKFIWDV